MKKITIYLILFLSALFLTSCNSSKYLKRPENTNLEFWITEKVTTESFKDCTYLPGGFGSSEYLGSAYEPVIRDPENPTWLKAPAICVTYSVTSYPDYSSKNTCVQEINITDPSVYVYDLTISSPMEDISSTMKSLGFKKLEENKWKKNNCIFDFSEERIRIFANVTNKFGIIF